MESNVDSNQRPQPDKLLVQIADYVCAPPLFSEEAYHTARLCLMDSLGCAMLALDFPECSKLLGPVVPGTKVPNGARVPGTDYELDPIKAAWDLGALIRWLDFNDTWLAAEWGHPSDNLGAILMVADFQSRQAVAKDQAPLTMANVLTAMIQAHEIQGVLALTNSFNRVGLDHVLLVKVASNAVITRMLGGSHQQVVDALSQAWIDGQSLRTYRHAPNTGSRKSWAAGDATSRAVKLAMLTLKGEMGYPSALTAPRWGFEEVCFEGQSLTLSRPLGCYVMENVLFKLAFPAEFHAQTAVEAAVKLYPQIQNRFEQIKRVELTTQESAIRIISKSGKLTNPADRDHCLQYMVAIGLLHGDLNARHYQDEAAADPRIDILREKMVVIEEESFSRDYLDPDKRSIANAVQVFFDNNTSTEKVEVAYPIGHRRRRNEGESLLLDKFKQALLGRFSPAKADALYQICNQPEQLSKLPVNEFVQAWQAE